MTMPGRKRDATSGYQRIAPVTIMMLQPPVAAQNSPFS